MKIEISADPNEFDPKKCVHFLQAHEDAVEKMGEFIFNLVDLYDLIRIKELIFTEICISLPSIIGSIILPFYKLITQSFIYRLRHTNEQLCTYQHNNNPRIIQKYNLKKFPDEIYRNSTNQLITEISQNRFD